ncbi:hypothetical protein C7Y69_14835 [Alteromonas sp. KS69]|uniref:hypothetical protein n=1 Tax=Alteromonas sp. KS69 TaxID=2109917 RepID=UPI000F8831FC|nr:hypothetical protein [Alteromonas sp. KS69]RUP78608.1 hypothetical protein C7Y69_14835 [Alteromonas sp. KS69]|tara:strand:+ start:1352 stop:2029 length:678 start_codon:yes stop_codon:yes gene_type:complete
MGKKVKAEGKSPHLVNKWENISHFLEVYQFAYKLSAQELEVIENSGEVRLDDFLDIENAKRFEGAWQHLIKLGHSFESSVQTESSLYSSVELERADTDEKIESGITPLGDFLDSVSNGLYPPPEIMRTIAACFKYYLNARGKVSLEHIFFGRETVGVGNESARRSKENLMKGFTFQYQFLLQIRPHLSQLEIAQEFLNHRGADDTDPESFLRSWRRWRKSSEEQS